MATVKIKLREPKSANGRGILVYQVSHRGVTQQLSSNIKLYACCWDDANAIVKLDGNGDEKAYLLACQRRVERDMKQLRKIVDNLDSRRGRYTVRDVIDRFREFDGKVCILAWLQKQIDRLEAENRMGTARSHRSTYLSLEAFLCGVDFPLELVDSRFAADYEAWLRQRGVIRNTVSFYMRVLRSVYNKAVRYGLVEQAAPFRYVYTGIDRTRKRAAGEDLIIRLRNLDLKHSYSLSLARDLFVFSFCMRGMAFVDLAYLRKNDRTGDIIRYVRRKTGQCLSVKLEACMQTIIDRYAWRTGNSVYLFPILRSEQPHCAYLQYLSALGRYNRQLRLLSKMLGTDVYLSSYTSRHTWATVARNHLVPISVISAGMGHTSERTTQIYLDTIENSEIDKANRQLLSFLNG